MENQFGTENLDYSLEVAGNLAEDLITALKDKRITWQEGVKLSMNVIPLVKTVKKVPEIFDEIKDLTPEERQASYQKFAENFELENKVAEEIAEKGIQLLLSIGEFVDVFERAKAVPVVG